MKSNFAIMEPTTSNIKISAVFNTLEAPVFLTLKRMGSQVDKNVSFRENMKIFPSILTIFIDVLDFVTFPCCNKTNDVSI